MERIEMIETIIGLEKEHEEALEKVKCITKAYEEISKDCNHIGVEFFDGDDTVRACILCGCVLDDEEFSRLEAEKLVIKVGISMTGFEENEFCMLRFMFLGLCKMNVNVPDQKVVATFNKMINESKKNVENYYKSLSYRK